VGHFCILFRQVFPLPMNFSPWFASKQHPWCWVRIANPRHDIPGRVRVEGN
jgi:hypothetical protein